MVDPYAIQRRLALLSGGLTGLALVAGLWGVGAVELLKANTPLYYQLALIGAAVWVVLSIAAAGLAARTSQPLLSALVWLVAAILGCFVAGHLPFEAATGLAWLADHRFWGQPIYPFDATAQARLTIGSLLPALVLTALGLAQDFRVEGIQSTLNARRLGVRSWVLMLLPLPVVFGAGLAADNILYSPLRQPLAHVAQIILDTRGYSGDLDALSAQTGLNEAALSDVRGELSGPFRVALGELDLGDAQSVVVVVDFANGAWINCRVLVDRVSFCDDAQPPYTKGLQLLLAGQDVSQCQDCQMQAGADWQAWLSQRGPRLGAPQITRLAQQGSYVLMRAASPAGGYALDCLFQGNRIINLVSCREE